jgi:hypothetical protein
VSSGDDALHSCAVQCSLATMNVLYEKQQGTMPRIPAGSIIPVHSSAPRRHKLPSSPHTSTNDHNLSDFATLEDGVSCTTCSGHSGAEAAAPVTGCVAAKLRCAQYTKTRWRMNRQRLPGNLILCTSCSVSHPYQVPRSATGSGCGSTQLWAT